MATEPKKAKPDYQAKLRAKAEEVHNQASDVSTDDCDKAIQIIYDALRTVALESWKNGIEAGQRKANRPPKTA